MSVQTKAETRKMGLLEYSRQHISLLKARVIPFAVVLLVLTGCSTGGNDDQDTTPVATPMPTVVPTPTPQMELGDVAWSTAIEDSGAPTEHLSSFPRDTPVIHAVVDAKSVPSGETLSAEWSLDGVAIDAIASTITVDKASGSGWVSFSLSWEGEALWPIGTLEVMITASSGATSVGSIAIEST